jgi:hypothetical protein
MRISLGTFLLAALAGAVAPAAAQQPSVRSVPGVVQPRVDQAQQRQAQSQAAQQSVQSNSASAPATTGQAQPAAQAAAPVAEAPPPPPQDTTTLLPTATVIRPGEPVLVFEREVFTYGGRTRRDPFRPLTGDEGPLFEDLRINVILYSPNPNESVVLLSDATNRVYRVRRGETVGKCCTIVDIGPTRIIFSVVDFGIRRQEVLALKSQREGA